MVCGMHIEFGICFVKLEDVSHYTNRWRIRV